MKKLFLGVLACVVLAAAGCGSDSSGGSDEDQVRDLIAQSAQMVGDQEYGNYCELLSPTAIEEIENSEGLDDSSCEEIMAFAGSMVSDSDIESMEEPESIEITGDTGMVTYEEGSDLDGFTVERVDGSWMIGPSSDDGSDSEDSGEPTKAEVRAWPAKFCSLEKGMTRDEVRAVMGEPTEEYSGPDANQDQWDGYEVNVTAFYDIDDRVLQLDDSTGTSNLPCDY